jgi:hypothetical protein
MMGSKVITFAKQKAAKLLVTIWQNPYSQACGYVWACLNMAIVYATYLCLHRYVGMFGLA